MYVNDDYSRFFISVPTNSINTVMDQFKLTNKQSSTKMTKISTISSFKAKWDEISNMDQWKYLQGHPT